MYPVRVELIPGDPGPSGVLVRFEPPGEPIGGYVVYRSAVPIPPERTEDFYAGAFAAQMQRVRLDAQATALLDEGGGARRWYLVQALSTTGDLLEVAFTVESAGAPLSLPDGVRRAQAHPAPSRAYEDLPELVFRADDPAAAVAIRTLASSLEER